MDVRLQWLLPVVKLRKRIYDNSNSAEIEDIVTDTTANSLNDLQVIQTEYYERNHNEESRDFDLMQRRIQEIMDPMNSVDKDDCIYSTSVMTDLEAIIDNLDDFNSTVYTKAGLSKRQYVMQRYNLGLSRISNTQLKEGKLLPQENPNTICDGLLTSMGENTWNILKDHLEDIITVTDDEVIMAMKLVWERMKMIIEPSSAVALAPILRGEFKSKKVGIIISGGNVDLNNLPF